MKNQLRHLSLTTRLSISFSIICCTVFFAIGLLSYHNMQHLLAKQRDQNLTARVERIEIFLQDQESFQILVQHPRLYENMLGKEDNLLILKNQQLALIEINPLKVHIPDMAESKTITFLDNQSEFATTRLAYKTVVFNDQHYQLIAGTQLDEAQSTLDQYLWKLILYSLLGIVMASLLGRWVGLYLLKSLNNLIEQTHKIQGTQPHQRIEVKSTTVEVDKLSSAMNAMLEKIQINYDQLARFSEDIAHELRTPLNNLMGQTQIMLMQSRSQQELEQLLYSHLEEYERLSKMIDNMLFIARSEHSDYIIEKENIDLSNLILELVHYFEFLAEDRLMRFVLELEKGIQIYANADLLKRALSNLIINAIDYGFEDQDIVISTKSTENHIDIEVLTKNVFIDKQHLKHLFERFYQIESSRHAKAKTGGLGLSIVKSIMMLHNGEATAYNTQEGIVFSLKIKYLT
ncbi:heavy metal sensor histidine kinase [Acinetobacter terrae]|jgi:two-component system heavy metal sensor histidine kinase CusS|uniref:Sensor protein n=1 Tax=Acinetobacter terrae TaxID=2731247 RepID=A0A241VAK9_9GAMM|nr:heavy metal sensor histidine kinase [Acinetobacter terrae]NNG77527.1 heavy metal sensor histidine kinase [Acinetobacter terrae]NNH16988.1 heavy metal sensor histidine kinase [Acinetobacter terrae]NNH39137.1 heavy metal sensor histidine kinase [Acinetobacter terrae]NNH78738.1 heavy metal sensor histidine kinase [Acinetobacter terrae]NNH89225.1 heavy metal sensor histidine kinase [Acinetobacter terrae]